MLGGGFGVGVRVQFVCSNSQRALAKSVDSEILPLALPAMIGLGETIGLFSPKRAYFF